MDGRLATIGLALLSVLAPLAPAPAEEQTPEPEAVWIDVTPTFATESITFAPNDCDGIELLGINLTSATVTIVHENGAAPTVLKLNGRTPLPFAPTALHLEIGDVVLEEKVPPVAALVVRPSRSRKPTMSQAEARVRACIARMDATGGDAERYRNAAKLLALAIVSDRVPMGSLLAECADRMNDAATRLEKPFYLAPALFATAQAKMCDGAFDRAYEVFGAYVERDDTLADNTSVDNEFDKARTKLVRAGRIETALAATRWSIDRPTTIEDPMAVLTLHLELARLAIQSNRLELASKTLDQAESLARESDGFTSDASNDVWDLTLNVAELSFDADRVDHGFELVDEMLANAEDPERTIRALGARANALVGLALYDEAIDAVEQIEALRSDELPAGTIKSMDELAMRLDLLLGATSTPRIRNLIDAQDEQRPELLLNIALVRRLDGEHGEALKVYTRCFDEAADEGNQPLRQKAAIMAASTCLDLGLVTDAIAWLDEPSRDEQAPHAVRQAATALLALAHARTGDAEASKRWVDAFRARMSPTDLEWETSVQEAEATCALEAGDLDRCATALDELDASVRAMIGSQRALEATQRLGLLGRFSDSARLREDLTSVRLARATTAAEQATITGDAWRSASSQRGRMLLERLRVRDAKANAALDPATLRDRLEPGELMIEYAFGRTETIGYVASAKAGIRRVKLGNTVAIESDIRAFIDVVSSKSSALSETKQLQIAQRLASALIQPLVAVAGEDATILTLSIPPQWGQLPIEALALDVVGDGPQGVASWAKARLVIDAYETRTAPSTATVVAIRGLPAPATHRWLIVGDPKFGDEVADSDVAPAARDRRSAAGAQILGSLPQLPAARAEATLLGEHAFRACFADDEALPAELAVDEATARAAPDFALTRGTLTVATGAHATKALIRTQLEEALLAHLATHGFYDLSTGIVGLAFAADGDENGLLTPSEIFDLSLDLDLAVLATCDGAIGPPIGTDGAHSIAHALLCAGARSVIATRCATPDTGTKSMLDGFYEKWMKGTVSAAAALRDVKQDRRRTKSDEVRGRPARTKLSTLDELNQAFPLSHPRHWATIECYGSPGVFEAPTSDGR